MPCQALGAATADERSGRSAPRWRGGRCARLKQPGDSGPLEHELLLQPELAVEAGQAEVPEQPRLVAGLGVRIDIGGECRSVREDEPGQFFPRRLEADRRRDKRPPARSTRGCATASCATWRPCRPPSPRQLPKASCRRRRSQPGRPSRRRRSPAAPPAPCRRCRRSRP